MKLTVEIPATLLREAELFAAGHAQSVEMLVVEALRQVLLSNGSSSAPASAAPKSSQARPSPAAAKWLREWEQWVEDLDRKRGSGPSAREILRRSRR